MSSSQVGLVLARTHVLFGLLVDWAKPYLDPTHTHATRHVHAWSTCLNKRCGRSPDSCLCTQLEGPIPVELGFLEDLKELSIDHNLLTYVHNNAARHVWIFCTAPLGDLICIVVRRVAGGLFPHRSASLMPPRRYTSTTTASLARCPIP